MRICGYMFASSHYHLLLDVDDARQLSQFMGYVGSNMIARPDGRGESCSTKLEEPV